jgi:uncharacterized protein (DUF952 family)
LGVIYLLLRADEWETKRSERYVASPVVEGFVHCCDHGQVTHVREAFFPDERDLVKLGLDPTRLKGETRYEPGARGESERFPHVYGPIESADVIEVTPV